MHDYKACNVFGDQGKPVAYCAQLHYDGAASFVQKTDHFFECSLDAKHTKHCASMNIRFHGQSKPAAYCVKS